MPIFITQAKTSRYTKTDQNLFMLPTTYYKRIQSCCMAWWEEKKIATYLIRDKKA